MQLRRTISSTLALGLIAGLTAGTVAQEDETAGDVPTPASWSIGGDEPELLEGSTDDSVPGRIVRTGITISGEEIVAFDPRFAGVGTTVYNGTDLGDPASAAPPFGDDMSAPPPELFSIRSVARRIVNDGGAWSGSGHELEYMTEDGEDLFISGFEILAGEGEYEGLTLILTYDGERQIGWILPTDALQPIPELTTE